MPVEPLARRRRWFFAVMNGSGAHPAIRRNAHVQKKRKRSGPPSHTFPVGRSDAERHFPTRAGIPAGSRAAGAGGRGADVRPKCGSAGGRRSAEPRSAAHGLRGGRAVAPTRGAQLRRQGGSGGGRPKLRGAGAREPKASARGAARGKRAAPPHGPTTERRFARNARDAAVMPLVALAMQFAPLSAERGPTDEQIPARLPRGGASRAATSGAGAWVGAAAHGAAQLRRASSARRPRGRVRGGRAACAAAAARGKRAGATPLRATTGVHREGCAGETCGHENRSRLRLG
jgi:hypothetical protein